MTRSALKLAASTPVPEYTLADAEAALEAARLARDEAVSAVQAACNAFPGMADRRLVAELQPLSGNEREILATPNLPRERRQTVEARIAFHAATAAEAKAIAALNRAERTRDEMQAAADLAADGDGRKRLAEVIKARDEAVKAGCSVRAKVEKARGALVAAQTAHRAAEDALAEARERAIGAVTAHDGAQPPELKALRRAAADAADDMDIAAQALSRAEDATAEPDYAERKAGEAVEAAADFVLSLGFDRAMTAARDAAARMARLAWLAEALASKSERFNGLAHNREMEARVLNPGMCCPSDRRQAVYDEVRSEVAAALAALQSDPSAPLPAL